MKRTASVTCDGASWRGVATSTGQRGLDGVGAMENDNYGGGDDNYPVVAEEIETEGRGEGRGWHRQE